ncbi:MAG: phosphatase PAP2 family protein [Solirubrobacteraceae bacterium]
MHQPLAPITSRRSQFLLLILATLALVAYFPLDHRSTGVHDLATSADAWIPFVPLFAIPYLAFLSVLPIGLLAGLCSGRDVTQVAVALTIAFVVSDACFVLYPTYAPRPEMFSGWGSSVVRFIFAHDAPYNDFPSEHVASAVLFVLYGRRFTGGTRIAMMALAVLVVPSTVLIRQHTLLGALGGFVLALVAWRLADFVLRPRLSSAQT